MKSYHFLPVLVILSGLSMWAGLGIAEPLSMRARCRPADMVRIDLDGNSYGTRDTHDIAVLLRLLDGEPTSWVRCPGGGDLSFMHEGQVLAQVGFYIMGNGRVLVRYGKGDGLVILGSDSPEAAEILKRLTMQPCGCAV